MRPLAIDLFTGLHGWAEGLIAEGWFVIGVDITDMSAEVGAAKPEHFALLVQDVLTLHGAQFKDAGLIVSSSPCTDYSYMAMPFKRAKARAALIRADETGGELRRLNALFDAQFRIQREASEAAGRHVPMVVENVQGARPWVGPSAGKFGSYYLWGDVPALMPQPVKATKVPGFRFDGTGKSFQTASVAQTQEGRKHSGDWFRDPTTPTRQGGGIGEETRLSARRFTARGCGRRPQGRGRGRGRGMVRRQSLHPVKRLAGTKSRERSDSENPRGVGSPHRARLLSAVRRPTDPIGEAPRSLARRGNAPTPPAGGRPDVAEAASFGKRAKET